MANQLPSASWYAKPTGAYARDSVESFNNAVMIYSKLLNIGWEHNAICALLGNFEGESGYNPWRWESDNLLSSTDTETIATSTTHGYGLAQFTPSGKYILSPVAQAYTTYAPNFSDVQGNPNDGDAQITFIDEHADYYPTSAYPLSYAEFKQSNNTVEYLTEAWVYNYERPADPSQSLPQRKEAALYWDETLKEFDPTTPKKTMPLWMMCLRRF